MVVRHPLKRFFSGMKLKFNEWSDTEWIKGELRKHDVLLEYSGVAKEDLHKYHIVPPSEGMTIHAIDLINFIDDYYSTMNAHFLTQSDQCEACGYRYKYIIRLEEISEDAPAFMDLLNIANPYR